MFEQPTSVKFEFFWIERSNIPGEKLPGTLTVEGFVW